MSKARASPRGKKTSPRTRTSRRSSGVSPKLGRVIEALARVLRAKPWYLFGAQAVALHGVPRTSADVDVTVAVPPEEVAALVGELRESGFELQDIGDVESFVAATRVIPLTHEETGVAVDLVLAGPGFEDDLLARAEVRRFGATAIRLIEVNDLVVLKLLAGRPKDLEDVAGLLRACPRGLDRRVIAARLRELEAVLDVSDLSPRFVSLSRANPP